MNAQAYKLGEVLGMSFLQIPKALIINQKYKTMTAEAKLAYGMLLQRMQLSNLNGWVNDDNEVYIIYTREEMAPELNVGYKKAVAAFKELTAFGLILETRRGRGMANHIYILKAEVPEADAKAYTANVRHVKKTHQGGFGPEEYPPEDEPDIEFTEPTEHLPGQDLSNPHILICQFDTSRPAGMTVQDMSFSPTSNKELNNKYLSEKYVSQSIVPARVREQPVVTVENSDDGLTDILEQCELHMFDEKEAQVLRYAIERMYYGQSFRIGNAIFPQAKVRSYMGLMDYTTLELAYDKIRANQEKIRNTTGYIMSVIFNCICEQEGEFMLDPYLNSMYQCRTG